MAELILPSVFTNHMVLQRERPIPVWGGGTPGNEVRITLGASEAVTTVGDDGAWRVELPALPAGGPFTLVVRSGDDEIRVEDVLVGDVWLCSGQSNMQLPVRNAECAEEELARAANDSRTRLYLIPKTGADAPVTRIDARWEVSSSAAASEFSAAGYFFARHLRDSPALASIPLGLIDSSFGGTVVEAWMRSETLGSRFPGDRLQDSFFGWKPSSMYNGMIAPLAGFPLRGVLWYQGESNCPRPEAYERLFPGLIDDWRRLWNHPDLPFLFVQLPNFFDVFDGAHFTWIREVQARVAASVPHTAMAVAIDTCDGFDLHPKEKREIGRRLALLARRDVYGDDVLASGPVPQSVETEGDQIRVRFASTGSGLAARGGGEPRGFTVAGEDGFFRTATARIDGASVVLSNKAIPRPRFVRYAWSGNPEATLHNVEGLPLAPFRTDTFPAVDLEIERRPAPHAVQSPLYSVIVDGDGCVDHLKVRGRPLLAPPSDFNRGAAFYNFWGAVRLFNVRKEGPTLLATENETAAVTYRFEPEAMEWTLHNKTAEALPFRLRLSGETRVVPGDTPRQEAFEDKPILCASATVKVGNSKVTVEGLDAMVLPDASDGAADGPLLEVTLPPGGQRILRMVFRPAPLPSGAETTQAASSSGASQPTESP